MKTTNLWIFIVKTAVTWLFLMAAGAAPLGLFGQDSPPEALSEANFLADLRQLTFEGRRAGEGYYSSDGSLLVFQSERRDDNPFFQIYLLDLETGDVEPISPGQGKTTCAWIHPDNRQILFASTQADPDARRKQREEIEFRESGQPRRYSWDYDPAYELFAYDRAEKTYQQLTQAMGYDAEASYSPDGKRIAFASNRNAFQQPLSPADQAAFERDPAIMMEIYVMNADGSDVRQLTDVRGYDGGPFFSPDGKRICWRRFSEDGLTAEIMTMNVDGSDQRTITHMNVMSWAPFYHPSGEYLIFTTNKHGFGNFELYLVDANGVVEPVRVTDTDGFDGLASFSPDGRQLTWTSNRNAQKQSQIYVANWNHAAALEALQHGTRRAPSPRKPENITLADDPVAPLRAERTSEPSDPDEIQATESGKASGAATRLEYDPQDIMRHVDFLCRPQLAGRMTGSPGERQATAYVAAYFDYLGLEPAGDQGSWFQSFEFPNGAELGSGNRLTVQRSPDNAAPENATDHVDPIAADAAHAVVDATVPESADRDSTTGSLTEEVRVDQDWRPLTFSGSGTFAPAEVVFAGYGIVAPAQGQQPTYDSYQSEDIDVRDKWVMMLRFVPENVSAERRQHLQFYSELRKKAFQARQRGARGIIFVSGPNSQVRQQLVPLQNDFSPSGSSLAAISVSDAVASRWLAAGGYDLLQLQNELDEGNTGKGFVIPNLKVGAEIDVRKITGRGRNVLGRLAAADKPTPQFVVVGAHLDHLGTGKSGSSLARESEQGSIHFGADDNASGVAGMLEIAEQLALQKRAGMLTLEHDIVFAGWSGEELGLHGSQHFVDNLTVTTDAPEATNQLPAHDPPSTGDGAQVLSPSGTDQKPKSGTTSFHDFVLRLDTTGQLFLNGEPFDDAELDQSLKFIGQNAPEFVVSIEADSELPLAKLTELIERVKQHGIQKLEMRTTEPESTKQRTVVAALNMDMIGRMQDQLILQGVGSSDVWGGLIESKNAVVGLPLTLSQDTDLPTDASSFYRAGIPILSAFTGSHTDYHTPRDTPEKLDYPATARVARLMGLIARSLASTKQLPNHIRRESRPTVASRSGQRAYLGTVPSYGEDVVGVKLSDVTAGAPAAIAGVQGGDIIVGLAGQTIENIYDYTAIIDGLKIGAETTITVQRGEQRLDLKIIPGSRE